MSHEILLVAGRDSQPARERRRRLIDHAAQAVPGVDSVEVLETPTVATALVHTAPRGGTVAEIVKGGDGHIQVTVAATTAGLDAAAAEQPHGHLVGSEAGHVGVRILPDGTVAIGTDGVAYIPAYWAEHGDGLLLSTHLASLVSLGLPATEDTQGVLEYLVMVHPLQHRTTLRGAQLLPPGGLIEWRSGSRARCRARPIFVPSPESMSDDDALATFSGIWNDVIGDIIERTAQERPALGLSGGLDSRAIAVTAADLGFRPLSYTYGTSRQREASAASRVAERLGLPHMRIPVTTDRLLYQAAEITSLLDGAHSPAEMYELWFTDLLTTFTNVIINGLDGGTLWGDEKSAGLNDQTLAASHVFSRYSASLAAIRPYLTTDLQAQAESEIRRGITESIHPWDFASRADMAIFWKFSNKQLRWGSMLVNALRRIGIRLETPFRDSRFVRFAASLSAAQRRNGNLYLRAHREIFSRTADIGRSDDGNSPNHLNHVYWSGDSPLVTQLYGLARRHPVSAGRRAARHGAHVLAERARTRTGMQRPADALDLRANVFPADLLARQHPIYRERLATLIESAPPHSMLSAEALADAVSSLRAGRLPAPALELAKVATANLWLSDYTTRENKVRHLGLTEPA